MRFRNFAVVGILLLMTAAVIVPVLYSGYGDLNSAQAALAEKNYSDAAHFFELAARRLVWPKDLWEKAGLAAYRANDDSESIRLLEIARSKNSLSPQGWNALGIAYWNGDDHKTALAIWRDGSQAYP